MAAIQALQDTLTQVFGDKIKRLTLTLDELTIVVDSKHFLDVAQQLRDHPRLKFEQLIDLCGVDYKEYADGAWQDSRYAAVLHLLSLSYNIRLRLRVFAQDDEIPILPSVINIWNSADWFEREAFDLLGIIFDGHPDLRRILTDYGFVGHPFRKDFPVSGYVEMRYDEQQGRVIYQPVTIDPREITPRVIREENYGELKGRE